MKPGRIGGLLVPLAWLCLGMMPALGEEEAPLADIEPIATGSLNARGVALNRSGDEMGGYTLTRQAAESGDSRAQSNLGMLLIEGVGTPRKPKEGIQWLQTAERAGDPFAALGLGIAYFDGRGVAPDYLTSEAFFEKARATPARPEASFHMAVNAYADPDEADRSLRRQFELCMDADEAGHRVSILYCVSFAEYSADYARHLEAVTRAVTSRPWTEGTNLERAYVKEFFADSDEALRQQVVSSAAWFKDVLGIDLVQHVEDKGFRLDE